MEVCGGGSGGTMVVLTLVMLVVIVEMIVIDGCRGRGRGSGNGSVCVSSGWLGRMATPYNTDGIHTARPYGAKFSDNDS